MSFRRCPDTEPVPVCQWQTGERLTQATCELGKTPGGLVGQDVLRVRRLRKTVRSYAEQIEQSNQAIGSKRQRARMFFVTLTYRDEAPWARRHIADFVQRVRVWAKRKGWRLPYVWCAEMHEKRFVRTGIQKPHFHLLFWLPSGLTMPKPDKRGWWPHGHTSVERARTVGYLVKYTSKSDIPEGCTFPQGMRIYGMGGLDDEGKGVHRHQMLPAWIRERVRFGETVKRCEGGVFVPSTGEWFQCPYEVAVVCVQGRWKLRIAKREETEMHYSNRYGQTWEVEPGHVLQRIIDAHDYREREIRWAICMETADEMAAERGSE